MSENFDDSWIFALDALRERWEQERPKTPIVLMRQCIIPACGNGVPSGRRDRLCDRHYAPVSDAAIAREINRWL